MVPAVLTGISTFDRDREKLYSELADDFTMLDRMGNLVKRVSQLVKPSVIPMKRVRQNEHEVRRSRLMKQARCGHRDWR